MTISATHRRHDLTYGDGVEFKVLGPVEVIDNGLRVELGGPKQRAVLAMLIADAGNLVAVGTLIEGIYGEEAPDRAHRSIHTFISNLRGVVGEVIERRGEGYVFTAPRSQFDAFRFEDAVAAAAEGDDPGEASEMLRGALELWRGHPYAGVEAHTLLEADVTRLNELRVSAIESRVEADLEMGRDSELVAELEALTTEYPLNERLRSQQMLALYRAGRQAEALRAYEKTRLDLVEMGLDPSAELRELEQRMLDQDATLTLDSRPTVRFASVLVADVADPDKLADLRPDERHRLLSSQAAALDHAIVANTGRVFSQRGSALYAWFDEATDAASAATDAQIATEQWIPRLRVAISAGDVEEAGGEEISGPPISRAAALVAVAHGGQILLSAEAHVAITSSDSPGVGIRSLGSHTIPGMQDGELVYQLEVGGELNDFPKLRIGDVPPPLPISERGVVGYELREEVGVGPYGAVHRAYQPSMGREVAVKVIRAQFANDTAFIRRFEVEAQLVARLEHPNIVPLQDYWREPEGAFLVMRWLRGGSLADRLEAGPLSMDELDSLVRCVGSALEYGHRHGVAHGGVKASNVLFDEEHNVYLSDFGVGRPADVEGGLVASDVERFAQLIDRCAEDKSGIDDLLTQATSSPGFASAAEFVEGWDAAVGRIGDDERHFTPARNPYKGLSAFGELDAADFYGRDDETTQLIEEVREKRLVAVVGPSGIGKSSVVRAGLISSIRSGTIEGSGQWLVTDMMPGRYPFEELTSALLRVAVTRSSGIEDELRRDTRGLVRVIKRYLPEGSTLLLVLDQFEELFTLVDDEEERSDFLALLAAAVNDDRCNVRIVLTMRADFFDRPLRFGEFGELLRDSTVPIAAPTAESMRAIVEQPAVNEGMSFEPGLVDRILGDVNDQPGALPLLEFSLTELFDRRTADQLSARSYDQTGGVLGALGRRAQSIYESLPSAEQTAARQLFLRLVRVEESGRDTRRRARMTELGRLGIDGHVLSTVLSAFGDHRLLTFDRDPITRGPTVEVAHEALLAQWSTLSDWIDDQREDLLLQRRLSTAVSDWEVAEQSSSYLLTGGRLAQHLSWTASTDLILTSAERDYLEVSSATEALLVAKRRRTRRSVMAGFVVVALVAAAFAFAARQNASDAANNADLAKARELGASAVNVLDEDPELSILLNLEAIASTPDGNDQPVEVIDALWSAVQQDRLVRVVDTGFDDGVFVALSPDESKLFVVVGFPASGFPEALAVQAYSTTDFEMLWEHRGNPADLEKFQTTDVLEGDLWYDRIYVSPDGQRVALGLTGAVERFIVFDASDGSTLQTIESEGCGETQSIPWGWSPDGSVFVVTGDCPRSDVAGGNWVEVLDGESFAQVALIDRASEDLAWASFDESGRLYLYAPDEDVTIFEPSNYSRSTSLEGVRGRGDVSPDGSLIVTFDSSTGRLASYDTATGDRVDGLSPLPAEPNSHGVAFGFSGSDDLFVTPTSGAQTIVWNVTTGDQAFSLPSGTGINAVLTSDGRRLYTGHPHGRAKVWDLGPSSVGLVPEAELGAGVEIGANSITAAENIGAFDTIDSGGSEPRVHFFDLDTGALVGESVEGSLAGFGGNPIRALAGDRFLITGSGAQALSWFVYDPSDGVRTPIAGCELDLEVGVCVNGDEPPFFLWFTSDDGSELIRQGDGQVTLISPADGAAIGQLTPAFFDPATGFVAQLSESVITGSNQSALVIEDRATGAELARLESAGSLWDRTLDGRFVAFDRHKDIAMLDNDTLDIWDFPTELGRILGLAIFAETRRIAAADENGIHIFDFDTGKLLTSIPMPGVVDLHWLASERLVIGTQAGEWSTLSLRTEDLIASATNALTRGFTPTECETYRVESCPTLEEMRNRQVS